MEIHIPIRNVILEGGILATWDGRSSSDLQHWGVGCLFSYILHLHSNYLELLVGLSVVFVLISKREKSKARDTLCGSWHIDETTFLQCKG